MIKKLRIGATVPSVVAYGNTKMEIEVEAGDNEDIFEATARSKALLAELISGGDSRQFKQALDCLNYPAHSDEMKQKVEYLENLEEKLNEVQDTIDEKHEQVRTLLESLEKYEILDRLKTVGAQPDDFWESFSAILKEVYPEQSYYSDTGEQLPDNIEQLESTTENLEPF